jgi:hypothetical protein
MDNNLTGLVAINLAQTGWLPYFSAFAGPLSAAVGAGVALFVQRLTQKKEKQKERKQAYINLMATASIMEMNPHPITASYDFAKYFAEVEVIGSEKVISKMHEMNINPSSPRQNTERIRNELSPLMRIELQD